MTDSEDTSSMSVNHFGKARNLSDFSENMIMYKLYIYSETCL